jgi:hypothetical protein
MKINRKDLKVKEDKESQFCGAINWQILWLRRKLCPSLKNASALSVSVESLVEVSAQ